ncbi:ATP-dependent DNA helicase [Isoalcanivorax beigongshangi]|uniref:ATP-dependent DNA helicase n=1 Tax=Isoalcanivorax beigongshangi TaxID=3238810 RepID=A0ABV4AHF8_9GAMM
MSQVRDILQQPERFAAVIPGFRARAPQLDMAEAVESALADRAVLVAEAETGTGKTLAYLVPALLSDGPTIVSTGTKSLQDQLFFKDLPVVLKALGVRRRVALLKGRANYLCPYRLELNEEESRFLSRETAEQLQIVAHWAGRTSTGDLAELQQLPQDAPVWPWVTSTADNCIGQDCPKLAECPVMKARQAAQEADLVVVNHHLFFADAALRNEDITELLPSANAVIFDEAHQLPDVAASFFGESLSTRQLSDLCRDAVSEAGQSGADVPGLVHITSAVERAAADFRLALGEDGRRAPWKDVSDAKAVQESAAELITRLALLEEALQPFQKTSRGMDNCLRRAGKLLDTLRRLIRANDARSVYWFENFRRSVMLHATPLTVADAFQAHRARHQCAWIFTSATLSVAGDFSHFIERLGLGAARTLHVASPFDFRRQAVLYVPEGLPMPDAPDYTRQLVDKMVPVIEAAQGRTFFLFTSHRALREAAQQLRSLSLPYPLLVQGEAGRRQLLDDFRAKGNAVLLGAASFWEGIDVRGDALSCVIIDKLPFGSPGDPVAAARIDHIRAAGGQPFWEFQLPEAVLTLRQGAGRLIRDHRDRGLLVMADPRIVQRSYGRLFLGSLPGMTRTRKLDVVQRFFHMLATESSDHESDQP